MTRPYFKKTLTLSVSENGNTPGKWNSTQANAASSASCLTKVTLKKKAQTSSYFLHGQTLETSTSKYLGITISSDLSWSTQFKDVAAKGNHTVGFL